MNWRFIISWTVKFTICLAVWNLAAWITNSVGLAFFLALGILILLAIVESFILDWMEKKKNKGNE